MWILPLLLILLVSGDMPRKARPKVVTPVMADAINVSGLEQPSVNLGGLLSNTGMSGTAGPTMSGATAAGGAGGGMTGGMDLAELLQSLGDTGAESFAGSGGGAPGELPFSLAQKQQTGMGSFGGQGYVAGSNGSNPVGGNAAGAQGQIDPTAFLQKVLGLGQKAAMQASQATKGQGGQATGGEQPSSDVGIPSPTAGGFGSFAPYTSGEAAGMGQGIDAGSFALGTDSGIDSLALEQYSRYLQGLEGLEGNALGFAGTGGANAGLDALEGNALGLAGTEGAMGAGGDLGLSGALGAGGAGLGALSGLLSLYGGAQSGNPLQAGQGALSTYNSIASLMNMLGYEGLPSLGSLGTSAISSISPELGAVLGGTAPAVGGGIGGIGGASLGSLGSGAVVGGAELGGLGAAGAGAGSAVAPATTAGIGAGLSGAGLVASAYALPVMIGIMAAMGNMVEAPEKRLLANLKDTAAHRKALGGNINTIGQNITAQGGLDYANMTPEQLQSRWNDLQQAIAAETNVNWNANTGGSTAPSKIARLDPTMLQNVQGAYHERLVPEMAALQDAMAMQGVPLDQFFQPGGATDILQLAARGTGTPNAIDVNSLSPEQLAGIGPGNMLQALQAIRSGGDLTGLNPAVGGYQQARLDQARRAAELGGGQEYSQYFFSPQQMAGLNTASDQARMANSYGATEFGGAPQAPAVSPQQMYQQMLAGYQLPQVPAGMWGPLSPAQPAMTAPVAAPGGAVSPQMSRGEDPRAPRSSAQLPINPALLMALFQSQGGRMPGFGAVGEEQGAPQMFQQYLRG